MNISAPAIKVAESSQLGGLQALEQLEEEWWTLWESDPLRTAFQSPAWLLAWFREFGADCDTRVLTVRSGGKLKGLLPLVRWKDQEEARPVFNIAGGGISDFLGGTFDRGGIASATAMFEHIRGHWPAGTQLDLQQLLPGSPLMEAPVSAPVNDHVELQDACPALELPRGEDDFYAELAPKFRQAVQYARRRLAREFAVEFITADSSTCGELMEVFCDLHARRWRERSEPGVLADSQVREFHASAAQSLARRGALRLHLLRLDGEPAGAFYGFKCGAAEFFYLGGFDPEFEKFSAGTVIVDFAIRQAIAEGCEVFHFLRGREPYKYKWGAQDIFTHRRILRVESREPGRFSR